MEKSQFMKQYEKCLDVELKKLQRPRPKKDVKLTDINLKEFKRGSKKFAAWLGQTIAEKRT